MSSRGIRAVMAGAKKKQRRSKMGKAELKRAVARAKPR